MKRLLAVFILTCGCAAERVVELDSRDTSIRYSDLGITINGEYVSEIDVVKILHDQDIPTDRVIHIRVDPNTKDLNGARTLMGVLAKGGYTRPVLITERHADAYATGKKSHEENNRAVVEPKRKKIRYKRTGE